MRVLAKRLATLGIQIVIASSTANLGVAQGTHPNSLDESRFQVRPPKHYILAVGADGKMVDGKMDYGNPVGYTPAQIKRAYNCDDSIMGDGAGQTIALIEGDAPPLEKLQFDLDYYSDQFKLPRTQ